MEKTLSNPASAGKPKLLDRVRSVLRLKHYSLRTEEAYTDWTRRFILFHQKRHPEEMGAGEVTAFLTHLAEIGGVAASTVVGANMDGAECRHAVNGRHSLVR